MSQSLRAVSDGMGVGPIGSVQLSVVTLPIDNSRFLMKPVLVFISSIFILTFLVVKLRNLCKGLAINSITIFLNLSRFKGKSQGEAINMEGFRKIV
jgi:hypothetical protein